MIRIITNRSFEDKVKIKILEEENTTLRTAINAPIDKEVARIKIELELRFQQRLTVLQEKYNKDILDRFDKEMKVLKETYQALINDLA